MTKDHKEAEEFRAEAAIAEVGVEYQTTRALVLWAVRWTIGFAIIWAITAWTGAYSWLWTAGFIVAVLSLVVILAMRILFQNRLRSTHAKTDELNKTLDEFDAEEELS